MTGPAASVDLWTIGSAIGTVVAAVSAVAGLVFVGCQLRQNSRALQLQVLEGVFRDIRELDKAWIEKKFHTGMSPEEKMAWCAGFFNTVEYLCFLINRNMVRHKELRDFFILGLREWRKQFEKCVAGGLITDTPAIFVEFKLLCEREGITISGPQSAPL